MKALLLFLLAAVAPAQTPTLYVDLSDGWARLEPGQPPRPFRFTKERRVRSTRFQLQRTVHLPAEGLANLGLLMTPFSTAYAVKVNGTVIGRMGTFGAWLSPRRR